MAAGSIIIDLLMRTGAFETDSKRAEKRLAALKKEAVDLGAKLGTAFAAAGMLMAVLTKQSIDAADAATDVAQAVGMSVEEVTALTYAAGFANLNQEQLSSSLVKLTKNASDAARGTGEAVDGFRALGISVTDSDGKLKASGRLLEEVASKLSQYEDGANKTALAVNIFGKSGAELLPLLNMGAEGIQQLKEEAASLGLVMSTEAAESAAQFNDTLDRLQGAARGLFNRVAQELLPSLNSLADGALASASATGNLDGAARVAATGVRLLMSAGLIVGGVFKTLGEYLGGFAATLAELFSGNWRRAFNIAMDTASDFAGNIKSTISSVSAVWDEQGAKVESKAPTIGGKLAAPAIAGKDKVAKATKAMRDDVQRTFDQIEKQIATMARDVAVFGKSETETKLFDLEAAGATPEQLARARELLDTLQQQNELRKQGEDAAKKAEEQQRQLQQLLDSGPEAKLDKQRQSMLLLADAYERGAITVEQYTDAATGFLGLNEQAEKGKSLAEDLGLTFSSAFEDAVVEGRKLSDVLKGLEQDLLRIMARKWVTEPLGDALSGILGGFSGSGGGGGGGGGFLGNLFGGIGELFAGFFADGGSIPAGQFGVVGEAGPELVTGPATVTPLARGGSTVNQHFHFSGPVDRRTQLQVAAEAAAGAQRALARNG